MGTVTPMSDQQQKVSDATREEDRKDAQAAHDAGPGPTGEEEAAAEAAGSADPNVAKSASEQYERGANNPGEGRLP